MKIKKIIMGILLACLLVSVMGCAFLGSLSKTVFLETYQASTKMQDITIAGYNGELLLTVAAPTDTKEFAIRATLTQKDGQSRTFELGKGTYTGDLTDTRNNPAPRATITEILKNGQVTKISPYTLTLDVTSSNSFRVHLREFARMCGIDTTNDTRWNEFITFNSSLQNIVNESRN